MKGFIVFTSIINKHDSVKKYLQWFVNILIFTNSIYLLLIKAEYEVFTDCLFHSRKMAQHPWIGERTIEYAWVYKHIRDIQNCKVLDVGAKNGLLTTDMLLENGNEVYALDLNARETFQQGNLNIEQGDIVSTDFGNGFFDAVILISTLEHIGVVGRYGIKQNEENLDFSAMNEVHRILKPGGKCFITVPYGVGKSLPMNRLYDQERCKQLFTSYQVKSTQYYVFNAAYKLWLEVSESEAGRNDWDQSPWYALACYYLIKPF